MSEAKYIEFNKTIYRRFIQEIFNEGRLDKLNELVSPDYVLHEAPPGTPSGPDAIKEIVMMFQSAFPDLKITLDELVAEGDRVTARATTQGTHKGAFLGISATGKAVKITGLTLVRIS